MITFKLINEESTDTIVQINPEHIITITHEVETDFIPVKDVYCHISLTKYSLINGKEITVLIVLPLLESVWNNYRSVLEDREIPREEFINYLDKSLNFEVVFIKWSK